MEDKELYSGCFMAVAVGIVALLVNFFIFLILTKLLVWALAILFDYDLSDMFWYIYVVVGTGLICFFTIYDNLKK